MSVGVQSLPSFAITWTAMTAAMMTPSTLPFVVTFARRLQDWPVAVAVVVAAYLLVWTGFGIAAYYASMSMPMSIPATTVAAAAIAFVGLYALTPVMRTGRDRCIEMCRRIEPIAGLGVRPAIAEGTTYGINCVACSAGVMLGVMVLGMTNLALIAAGAAMVFLYKLSGRWTRRIELVASILCVVTGAGLLVGL